MIIPFDGGACDWHSNSGVCVEIALMEAQMFVPGLNYDRISDAVRDFEESHNGYMVTWYTTDTPLGIYSVNFRVTSMQYRLRVDATGADGVPSMSMIPDEMCITITKAVSVRTLLTCIRGPEFVVEETLERMVGELEEHRKSGLTGTWMLPDS